MGDKPTMTHSDRTKAKLGLQADVTADVLAALGADGDALPRAVAYGLPSVDQDALRKLVPNLVRASLDFVVTMAGDRVDEVLVEHRAMVKSFVTERALTFAIDALGKLQGPGPPPRKPWMEVS